MDDPNTAEIEFHSACPTVVKPGQTNQVLKFPKHATAQDANGNPRRSSQLVEQATRFRRELGQARVFDDRGQGSIVVEQQSQLLAAAVGGQQWTERILSESVHEPASTRTAEWPLVGGLSPTDASVSLA